MEQSFGFFLERWPKKGARNGANVKRNVSKGAAHSAPPNLSYKSLETGYPYILAYKSRNFGQNLNLIFTIRLICELYKRIIFFLSSILNTSIQERAAAVSTDQVWLGYV